MLLHKPPLNYCHRHRAYKNRWESTEKNHRRPTKRQAFGTREGNRAPLGARGGGERPERGKKRSQGPRGNERGGF